MEPGVWRKSSFSNGNGGNNCVEVLSTLVSGDVFVRHTQERGRFIMFTQAEWDAFIKGVKNGEFG